MDPRTTRVSITSNIWTSKFKQFKSLHITYVASLVTFVVDMPFEPSSFGDVERIWVIGQRRIAQLFEPFNPGFF